MNATLDRLLNHKMFISLIIPLGTSLFFGLVLIYAISHEHHANKDLMSQINAIQKQIFQIADTGSTADFKTYLSGINNELNTIKTEENITAKSADIEKVATQIKVVKQNIDELKKMVSENSDDKEFIDAKELPFHVMSVDVISQQPYVSIDYDHHITPLGIGDTIAGWQITDADYASSSVEFKNNKGQYVKVNL